MRALAAAVEREPPFRRRRLQVPRRRRRALRRLLAPFLGALLMVGAVAGAGYWLATATAFRVADVAVKNGERVSRQWAEARLGGLQGRHIMTLGLDDVERSLSGNPWLRGVEVAKRPPSRVDVTLLEKEPVAILRAADGLFFLDRKGEVIRSYEAGLAHGGFVIVEVSPDSGGSIAEALQVIADWREQGGRWADGLSEVTAVDATSFRLVVSGLGFPLLIDRGNLARLAYFESILPEINRRFPALRMADLRFSGQVVVQPVALPPTEG